MKRRFGLSDFGLGTDEPVGLVTKGYSFYSIAIYEPISNMESLANIVGSGRTEADPAGNRRLLFCQREYLALCDDRQQTFRRFLLQQSVDTGNHRSG